MKIRPVSQTPSKASAMLMTKLRRDAVISSDAAQLYRDVRLCERALAGDPRRGDAVAVEARRTGVAGPANIPLGRYLAR